MARLAAEPVLLAVSGVELATIASRMGAQPWSPLARRAVGVADLGPITGPACARALVGLVQRGLVAPADGEGVVEVHPAAAAVVAVLERATVLVEAVGGASGLRRAFVLVPGAGGLLVDATEGGDLLIALLDADVPVPDAEAVLGELGPVVVTRADDPEAEEWRR